MSQATARTTVQPEPGCDVGAAQTYATQPETPGLARRLVRRMLAEWGRTPLIDACEVVVSELASNAVRHTGCRSITVSIRMEGWAAVIAVRDCSRELPLLVRDHRDDDENGRGLDLVDRLSDTWGVQPEPHGKTVWARVSARL